MKAFRFLTLSMVLLAGCTAPKKQVIVIHENTFFRCEPSNVVEKKMVRLINNARARERKCGFKRCAPVPPVRWDSKLAKAALNHSKDMAKNDILSHMGSDGSVLNERLEGVGYVWYAIGENISGGRETCEDVVSAWLSSPRHCRNIMDPSFTEIGAACFRNQSSKYGTYWTLVLASPRE